ncbi:hypothetical protein ADUPG1_012180 [Aduncisulcus paluster]|uniref:Uncharacterized protein n=1 Tax=Aduncisulcus paluster TaxID=2918883 RepID=A0ABQ5K1V0_9EUKA|nr:hypothetical protein ADUPG1_012180 [Aduncisulcus paluster]
MSNVFSSTSSPPCHLSNLLHCMPMIAMIPSIETLLSHDSCGFIHASHVRSVAHWMVKEVKKEMKKEFHSESHTFLIQYTPPQHMLVMMPFDEGRSLRQSVYDLIECTGGGVEMLFEQGSCYSFEEYDQEAWRKGMEEEEEEEEETSLLISNEYGY